MQYFVTFLGLLFAAFSFLFIANKSSRLPLWAKRTIQLIVFAGIFELLLFQNPLFFKISMKYLNASDIGWRQNAALKKEILRFKKGDKAQYLAVGSSQTGAVYGLYTIKNPDDLSVFSLAGMGPLDFYLYKELIKKSCSGTILLMLSDFDLKEPSLIGAKLAPPQKLKELLEVVYMLLQEREVKFSEIQDFVLANIISAYRYQYIFKGFLTHFFNRNLVWPEKDVTMRPDQFDFSIHLRELGEVDAKWFEFSLSFLDRFLFWTKKNGLDVMIIQGHYHPQAINANHKRYEYAASLISFLSDKYPNVHFVHTKQIFEFSEKDYKDGVHVYGEVGYRFAEKVMHLIQDRKMTSNAIFQ